MRCSYTTPNGFSQVLKASELEPFFLRKAKRSLLGHHLTSEGFTIQLTTGDGQLQHLGQVQPSPV
jgi:hypothetical protein